MLLKSKDLIEKIEFQIGKELIEKDDLENIKTIVLNGTKINGEKSDIEIKEIVNLPNIEECFIINFKLKKEDIESINKLKNIKAIQFENCDFSKVKTQIKAPIEILIMQTCVNFEIDKLIKKDNLKVLKINE